MTRVVRADRMLGTMKSISETLRAEILRCGIVQHALAKKSDVDPAALFRFIVNERDIRLQTADKLCRALGLELTHKGKGP